MKIDPIYDELLEAFCYFRKDKHVASSCEMYLGKTIRIWVVKNYIGSNILYFHKVPHKLVKLIINEIMYEKE